MDQATFSTPNRDISRTQAGYALATLILGYVFSIMDRQILTLLVGAIQADLDINDTLIGLLHGFSFALFYGAVGLPIARWADHGNRRWLLTAGIAMWCLATAASGFAQNYTHLLIARVFVAVGEAVLLPTAVSLIADCYSTDSRNRALGIFGAGGPVGAGLGLFAGGYLMANIGHWLPHWGPLSWLQPWQGTFLVLGASGLLVAMMAAFIIEPRRQRIHHASEKPISSSPLGPFVRSNARTFVGVILGTSFFYLSVYASSTWIPTFFVRSHTMAYSEIGMTLGAVLCAVGPFGAYLGSVSGTKLAAKNIRQANLKAAIVGSISMCLCTCGILLSQQTLIALLFLAGNGLFWFFLFGLGPGLVLDIAPEKNRAQVMALFTGALNLIGAGCGPLLVGYLSDYVFTDGDGIRSALLATTLLSMIGSVGLYFYGSKQYDATQQAAHIEGR